MDTAEPVPRRRSTPEILEHCADLLEEVLAGERARGDLSGIALTLRVTADLERQKA